jgi:dihydroorotate dehydrogenase
VTPPQEAAADYAMSAGRLAPYADYVVVNVSSPNTPGLRDLQSVDALRPILVATREAADAATTAAGRPRVPLLVKIAPDLSDDDVDAIADLATELDLDGVVAVNTTTAHPFGEGGLSGPPLLERGLDVVARLRTRLGPDPVIIGVGGISTPADAREYLANGATLVQGYTGLIYRGPFWAAHINRALAADAVRRTVREA